MSKQWIDIIDSLENWLCVPFVSFTKLKNNIDFIEQNS